MSEVVVDNPAIAPGRLAHQMATRAAFLVAGFTMASWGPLIPYAKQRLQVSDGQLGLLLLCLGTGSLIGMPSAGGLAGRYGCRIVIICTALTIILMLPVLAVASHVWLMAAALLLFGAGLGMLDVTMNIHASIVERDAGKPLMSGFHGLYSAGGILGAGCMSAAMSAGSTLLTATFISFFIALALLIASASSLLPVGGSTEGGAPAFALPRGSVLVLGFFCFALFLAEGSVLDWSALFLSTHRHVAEAHAALGYVAFSCAMTSCRLAGDVIVKAVGPARVVLLGSLLAAGGFLLAVCVPSAVVGIIGFGLVGVGASNVVPVAFSAAGRQTRMPANLAIAAITTMGYTGILLGPAMVGGFSQLVGLPVGIAIIAGMLVCVGLVSTRVNLAK